MNQSRPPYASPSIPGIPHIPTMQSSSQPVVPQPAYTVPSFNYSPAPANIRNQPAPSTYNYPPAAPVQPARSFTPHPNNNPAPITPPTTEVIPYQAPEAAVTPAAPADTTTPSKKSNFNIGDIKGFIDRMGGIDGLVSTMQKVQKVVQGFQQIAPVAKLLVGSFASGKSKNKDEDSEEMFYTPPKKRPKKRPPANKRRPNKKPASNPNGQRPRKGTAKASSRQKSAPSQPQIF
ncbi:hypothetical protein [Paenibacillus assamensis]|uniref:hypothetical protein n=1 Tax=Paenibacillus assamensis TaxID=311244 RepID=UPI000688E895|nr:hypothetical protein [Paenibacillus assamensis]